MIVSAILKRNQLEIRFHPEAPLDTKRLAALVEANRKRMKLTPSYQVVVHLEAASPPDYGKTFAQVEAVLQALEACESLKSWPDRSATPMPN